MTYCISKGHSYKLLDSYQAKFNGYRLHRYHVNLYFIIKRDLVEKIVVRSVDNSDCFPMKDQVCFRNKQIMDEIFDELIKEATS